MYRIGGPELKRVEKIFESGDIFRYGHAGECDKFEKDWGERTGTKYVRMVTSGTAAIYCALVGLSVGPGDEVITSPFSFINGV